LIKLKKPKFGQALKGLKVGVLGDAKLVDKPEDGQVANTVRFELVGFEKLGFPEDILENTKIF